VREGWRGGDENKFTLEDVDLLERGSVEAIFNVRWFLKVNYIYALPI
jgi:hypothetical protein